VLCQASRAALLGTRIHPAQAREAARYRRYYQHHEVLLIRRIRDLLYEQGFTISGARNRLGDDEPRDQDAAVRLSGAELQSLRTDLMAIRDMLGAALDEHAAGAPPREHLF